MTTHIATLGSPPFKIGLTLSLSGYSQAFTLRPTTTRIAPISNRVISWMSVYDRPMLSWFLTNDFMYLSCFYLAKVMPFPISKL
jgi:hypothetical protein